MTQPWSMEAAPRRRRRRLALALGLVVVFGASLAAGWAVAGTTPGAGGPGVDPAPGATAAALASAEPAPSAVPGSPNPGEAPPPSPSASPTPVPTPVAPPAVPAALAARLARALATAQKELALPGVEATVLFPDGSTWTGVRGLANAAAGMPVQADTPFAVGSVTKTFTAALILRDVEAGRIRLGDRLSRWLPDVPNADKVTIRQLLNHMSGIPDYFKNVKFDAVLNKDKKRAWSADEVLEGFIRPVLVFPPGTRWAYSNSNYLLLGMVAEKVGGKPWAERVRTELLDPLGLASTYIQGVEPPTAAPALAYRVIDGSRGPVPLVRTDGTANVPFTSVVTAAGAAGAIAATTDDLARWARALYGGDVLSPAIRKQMLTFVRAYGYGFTTSYGLGVSRVSFQGRVSWGHTGALTGTRAAIRYFPKDKIAVAVAFNREPLVGDDVVRYLARALFPKPPASASPSPVPGTSPRASTAP